MAAGCATETSTCDGVMFGGECMECPGEMVGGICVTGPTDVTESECSSDADCLPLAACLAGKCAKECTQDSNCPAGEECVLYRCVGEGGAKDIPLSDATGKVPCEKHLDCDALEMACIDGFCDRECTKDWHCEEENSACVGYMCTQVEPPLDVKAETAQDTLPENCNPTDGPSGAACNCKQECGSALCVQNKITNSNVCTQFCQNDAQCPGPDVCIPVDQTSVCIFNDSGQDTSCDPDMAFCYKGVFLTNKLGKCACTTPCTKAVDCPDGFACHALGADKVCVSTGENCSTDYNPCFGQCAGDPNTGLGFCTGICISSADCPSGWTCQPIADGVSVCASPF